MPFQFCTVRESEECEWALYESGGADYARAADYRDLHLWYVHGLDTIARNARISHWAGRRDAFIQTLYEHPESARKILGLAEAEALLTGCPPKEDR